MKKFLILILTILFISSNVSYAGLREKTKGNTMGKITQAAGRDALGNFAPDFAHYNDDILFGENWNNNDIDTKANKKNN